MTIPPLAAAVFWVALILAMTAGFVMFVRWWTRRAHRSAVTASQLLSQFRDLHARGGLSDEEFAHIKGNLGEQLQLEANEAASAESVAEAAGLLQQAAEALTMRAVEGAGTPNEAGGPNQADERDERERSDPGGGAAQDGCDEAPPNGGDSTR